MCNKHRFKKFLVRNLKKKEKKIKQLVNDLWFETMGYKIIMKTIILKMGLFPFFISSWSWCFSICNFLI
jgi:hypothetical protein